MSPGTHLAGIIAAQNNEIGLVGVAPEALVHIVRVYDDEDWFVYTSALVDAAYLCRDAGAKIISMSMGGDWPLDEEEEIFTELFNENGILSIASSGNWGDSSYSYPASYKNVLSVGALTRLEETAWFSQYNDKYVWEPAISRSANHCSCRHFSWLFNDENSILTLSYLFLPFQS